ncbi:hypothetical protein QR680_011751 [Steinernema hermaphroditum]|uniref:SXP/RAL-2 family protein Ani s 5-like cation-binding domain-containing protein n=1 Tax=Steinernema hermaphroditum TaxID=289476 RepID=A0AA39HZL3_9BILA|nr:hypothetical protein QR680_011751 [Steinernema hermaphroditum]
MNKLFLVVVLLALTLANVCAKEEFPSLDVFDKAPAYVSLKIYKYLKDGEISKKDEAVILKWLKTQPPATTVQYKKVKAAVEKHLKEVTAFWSDSLVEIYNTLIKQIMDDKSLTTKQKKEKIQKEIDDVPDLIRGLVKNPLKR